MRVAYNKYSRRFDFSAPPIFVPVLLACIVCWLVSYLYSVGYPVYGEVSATPLWNTICQALPGKGFTYIIGMAFMFGGAFLLHRANYVLVLIREKTTPHITAEGNTWQSNAQNSEYKTWA